MSDFRKGDRVFTFSNPTPKSVEVTTRIDGDDSLYTHNFTTEKRQGVDVTVMRWTALGESFCEWSADAWLPKTPDDIDEMFDSCEWVVDDTTNA